MLLAKTNMTDTRSPSDLKIKLLDAAMAIIRTKGYSGTTVDDICHSVGVSKGGFFHHFKNKEELAVSAAGHFAEIAGGVFSIAPYRDLPDPLDRLLGYVDFRKLILKGALPEFTCLLGTMVQEAYETHPAIREACEKALGEHVLMLEAEIAEVMRKYPPDSGLSYEWTAESLASYIQAVLQGAFVMAKARGGPEVAVACLDHLRRYLKMLFNRPNEREMP
jgi:TetR/AcrR family transcriptional regulator, transcriptional repressor for nem operon